MTWSKSAPFKIARELRGVQMFHQIQAHLLFPPECKCEYSGEDPCACKNKRFQILRSLNVDFYNRAIRERQTSNTLSAIKCFLEIPEDSVLREEYENVYPLWLIKEDFQKRIDSKEFQCISELVMILLRLAATYESVWRDRFVSLNQALEILLGRNPIKRIKKHTPVQYFGGEKICMGYWNRYRSVSHCIAALGVMVFSEGEVIDKWPLDFTPSEITRCLGLSYWFHKNLLSLETPNVKGKIFLQEEILLPLPAWARKDGISLPFEVFEEKIRELFKN